MKDFKKLLIWQKGMDIVDSVYDVVPQLPKEERYGLRSQMTRSAVSIPTNIAEGSAKQSDRDYSRYLKIALGSAFELDTLFSVVQRRKWMDDKDLSGTLKMVVEEQKMLQSFIRKLE